MRCYIWDGEEWSNLSLLADMLGISQSALDRHVKSGKTRTSQIRSRKDVEHKPITPVPFEYPRYSRLSRAEMKRNRINRWKLAMETDPYPDELMDKLLDRINQM